MKMIQKIIEFKPNDIVVFGFEEDIYKVEKQSDLITIFIPLTSSVWVYLGSNENHIIVESLEPGQRVGSGARYTLKKL